MLTYLLYGGVVRKPEDVYDFEVFCNCTLGDILSPRLKHLDFLHISSILTTSASVSNFNLLKHTIIKHNSSPVLALTHGMHI